MKSTRKQSLWIGIGLVFLIAMVALPVYGAVVLLPTVSPDATLIIESPATASESPFFGIEFGFLGWDGSTSIEIKPQMEPA